MNRKSMIALVTALGLGTAGIAVAHDSSDLRAFEAAKISLEQAISTAQQQYQGSRAMKAELETHNDKAQYEVKVLTTDKRVHEITIDAETGKVVENRQDNDD